MQSISAFISSKMSSLPERLQSTSEVPTLEATTSHLEETEEDSVSDSTETLYTDDYDDNGSEVSSEYSCVSTESLSNVQTCPETHCQSLFKKLRKEMHQLQENFELEYGFGVDICNAIEEAFGGLFVQSEGDLDCYEMAFIHINNAKAAISSYQAKLADLDTHGKLSAEEQVTLSNALTSSCEVIESLRKEVSAVRVEKNRAERSLAEGQETIHKQKGELETLSRKVIRETERADSLDTALGRFITEHTALSNALHAEKEKSTKLNTLIEQYTKQIAAKEDDIKRFQDRIEELGNTVTDLGNAIRENDENHHAELQKAITEGRETAHYIEDELMGHKGMLERLEAEKAELIASKERLLDYWRSTTADKDRALTRLRIVQDELNALKERFEGVNSDRARLVQQSAGRDSFEQEIKGLQERIKITSEQILELSELNKKSTEKNQELTKQLECLEEEPGRRHLAEEKYKALFLRLQDQNVEVEKLTQENEKQAKDLAKANEKIQNDEKTLESVNESLSRAVSETQRLQREAHDLRSILQTERDNHTLDLSFQRAKMNELQDQLSAVSRAQRYASSELDHCRQTNAVLTKTCQRVQRQYEAEKQAAETTRKSICHTEAALSAITDEIIRLNFNSATDSVSPLSTAANSVCKFMGRSDSESIISEFSFVADGEGTAVTAQHKQYYNLWKNWGELKKQYKLATACTVGMAKHVEKAEQLEEKHKASYEELDDLFKEVKSEMEAKDKEIETLNSMKDANERTNIALTSMLERERAAYAKIAKDLQKATAMANSSNVENERMRKALNALGSRLSTCTTDFDNERALLKEAIHVHSEKVKEITGSITNAFKLADDVEGTIKAVHAKFKECHEAVTRVKQLEQTLAAVLSERNDFKSEAASLSTELKAMREQLTQYRKTTEIFGDCLEALKHVCQNMKKKIEPTSEIVAEVYQKLLADSTVLDDTEEFNGIPARYNAVIRTAIDLAYKAKSDEMDGHYLMANSRFDED